MTEPRCAAATPEPGYPPEPWQLRGHLCASVFVVPRADVPGDLPAGYRPVRLGRFAVVGVAWVDYQPGGVLSYAELMATLLVRAGRRVRPTITHIWVDSVASRDGGRALWAIPKDLARFTLGCDGLAAFIDAAPLATGTVREAVRVPGRWPVAFSVVQARSGRALVSPVRARAGVSLARARFTAEPTGPLAFLAGRRPLLSFVLRDFRMRFGAERRPGGG